MSTTRYVGDAVVRVEYVGEDAGRSCYKGVVAAGAHRWSFDHLHGARILMQGQHGGDYPDAMDRIAAEAVGFGSYYTTPNRGDDLPEWAPSPEVADAIEEAVVLARDDQGEYMVRREPLP